MKLEKIYKQNLIIDSFQEKCLGLFTFCLKDDILVEEEKSIEEHILRIYQFLTGNLPMAQTILICNKETTSEEIIAFIYRAFFCKYPVLFIIEKFEKLTKEKELDLINLMAKLFSNSYIEMKSCLVFAYLDENNNLAKYIQNLQGHKFLKHDDIKIEGKISFQNNLEVISSDKAGVGKTTQIKLKVAQQKKNYIYFPISGIFNLKDVINRLNKLEIKSENNTVIHLDLDETNQTEIMNDLLFNFMFTKLIGKNVDLFYLSKKIEIIIEIPCGYINYFQKFPLLNFIRNKTEITVKNLPPLIIQEKLDSNIQIVCNYLKVLNNGELPKKDIIITNVSLSKSDLNDFVIDNIIKADNFFDAKSIEQNECETLIKNIFLKDLKLEYPTYYQINSFINLLAGQLKKLSMNFTLSATNLIESGIVLRMENLNNSRELVIKNFIKNINNFIHYSFDKIYNAQKDIYEMRYLNQKERLIANKKLLYDLEYISSYHNLEPFLFLFTEEGQNFRVISIDPPINEEYYKLLNLTKSIELKENYIYKTCGYKDKIIQLSKEIKNYKKINHYEFLEELKEFLSIKNPLYTKDKEFLKMEKIKFLIW